MLAQVEPLVWRSVPVVGPCLWERPGHRRGKSPVVIRLMGHLAAFHWAKLAVSRAAAAGPAARRPLPHGSADLPTNWPRNSFPASRGSGELLCGGRERSAGVVSV